MLGVTSLLRLLLRPFAVWAVFICGSLAFVGWVVVFLVRGGRHEVAGATAEQIQRNLELHLSIGTVLIPMALGAALAWAAYELVLCPFASHLPALRRRMFRALTVAGLVGAAATAWWCDEQPGPQAPLLFMALAFPCFSMGVLGTDPRFVSWGPWRWVLLVVFSAPILLAPEYVALGQRAPWLVGPLVLGLGVVFLWLTFSRAAMRARLHAPESMPALLPTEPGQSDWQIVPVKARQRARWNPGRTLKGEVDWTRASLHESFGHVRGGWIGAVVGSALAWSVCLVGIGLVMGYGAERDGQATLRYLYAMLAGKVEGVEGKVIPLAAVALPIWAAMFMVSNPFSLFGGGAYPLARAARAEVAWRASTIVLAGFVVALFVVLALFSEAVFRLSGLSERSHEIPEFMHALGGIAIGAPLVHAARLRWIERRRSAPSAMALSSLVGLAGLVLGLPAGALALLFSLALPAQAVLPWFAIIPGLAVFSQGWWRQHLRRHYLSSDLAV